jgi:hypothetical protein
MRMVNARQLNSLSWLERCAGIAGQQLRFLPVVADEQSDKKRLKVSECGMIPKQIS